MGPAENDQCGELPIFGETSLYFLVPLLLNGPWSLCAIVGFQRAMQV